jgi:hypothetical protein
MMPAKFLRKLPDLHRIPKAGDLVRVFVLDEPLVSRQPAVPNPNTVLIPVMPTVSNIQSRRPQPIANQQRQQERDAGNNCSPRRAFKKTFGGRAFH